MTFPWQETLSLSAVALGGAYLAHRAWVTVRGKRETGCGSCGTCPTESATPARSFVAEDSLIESLRRAGRG